MPQYRIIIFPQAGRDLKEIRVYTLQSWGVDLSLPIRKTLITTENTESKKQNHSVSSMSSVVKNSFEVFFVNVGDTTHAPNGVLTVDPDP